MILQDLVYRGSMQSHLECARKSPGTRAALFVCEIHFLSCTKLRFIQYPHLSYVQLTIIYFYFFNIYFYFVCTTI
ncbi:hypothetical protein EMCRGX_G001623 [Ephydatia muelleri]